ncbi:MAG TPA: RIO1 family regulatory kinase/ATPase [Anaerolineales bacterium]|nr:RIO1 family regulatory kinase/ATPase [Anaerolineales bacterium]
MPSLNLNALWFDEDDNAYLDRKPSQKAPPARRKPQPDPTGLAADAAAEQEFAFSYQASRHERQWIDDSLGSFYHGQVITDILRQIKGGKEASVYLCAANPDLQPDRSPYLAAKVYRPRRFRSLKNDHLYREGRANLDADGNPITNDGMLHAIRKRTEYGRQLLHTSWIEYEYQTLMRLAAAGLDVPAPLGRGDNAILMAYIGSEDMAAPTLNSVTLPPAEARLHFERLVHNLDQMLALRVVHADLSPFNILYWEGEITLIDFPQAIDPLVNRSALNIFERDVRRVCEYFEPLGGLALQPRRLARDLWRKYDYPLRPDVHPGLLDDDDQADRAYWEQLQSNG